MTKHPKQNGGSHPAGAEQGLSSDLLMGAAEIARFMFGSENERRRVYWLAESGQLPVFRLGTILCARRSSILRDLEEREAEVRTAPTA